MRWLLPPGFQMRLEQKKKRRIVTSLSPGVTRLAIKNEWTWRGADYSHTVDVPQPLLMMPVHQAFVPITLWQPRLRRTWQAVDQMSARLKRLAGLGHVYFPCTSFSKVGRGVLQHTPPRPGGFWRFARKLPSGTTLATTGPRRLET